MQCIAEPTKQYADLDSLRQDLSQMDVKETPSFPLRQMQITNHGTVEVAGVGEFLLSDIALADAIRRGGLQFASSQNFFAEQKPVLDDAILTAVNTFYRHSRYADAEIKLVTRSDASGSRVTLGIPSTLVHQSSIWGMH